MVTPARKPRSSTSLTSSTPVASSSSSVRSPQTQLDHSSTPQPSTSRTTRSSHATPSSQPPTPRTAATSTPKPASSILKAGPSSSQKPLSNARRSKTPEHHHRSADDLAALEAQILLADTSGMRATRSTRQSVGAAAAGHVLRDGKTYSGDGNDASEPSGRSGIVAEDESEEEEVVEDKEQAVAQDDEVVEDEEEEQVETKDADEVEEEVEEVEDRSVSTRRTRSSNQRMAVETPRKNRRQQSEPRILPDTPASPPIAPVLDDSTNFEQIANSGDGLANSASANENILDESLADMISSSEDESDGDSGSDSESDSEDSDENSSSETSDSEDDDDDDTTDGDSESGDDDEEAEMERLLAAARAAAISKASGEGKEANEGRMVGLGDEDVLNLGDDEEPQEMPIPRLIVPNLPTPGLSFDRNGTARAGPSRIVNPAQSSRGQSKDNTAGEVANGVQAPVMELDERAYERPLTKREKAALPKKATTSELWSTIPSSRSDLLPQMKRDYQALALASTLDPKRFMKGGNKLKKVPENFAIGTVIEQSRQLQSTTLAREQRYRPGQIVQQIAADQGVNEYAKRKFEDLQSSRMQNGRGKGWKHRKRW